MGQLLFQDSGKTIHSAEKNDASYKQAAIFTELNQKKKKNQNHRLRKLKIADLENWKWPPQKEPSFSSSNNSQYFFMKFFWIGSWVSRLDWCEGHCCGLTYMVKQVTTDIYGNYHHLWNTDQFPCQTFWIYETASQNENKILHYFRKNRFTFRIFLRNSIANPFLIIFRFRDKHEKHYQQEESFRAIS